MIANRIFFAGARLPDFQLPIAAMVAVALFLVLGPMLVFTRKLEAVASTGVLQYGALAQRYVRDFDQKWLRGGAPAGELLLGNEDIESLADMGNSFVVVQQMRWVLFTLRHAVEVGTISLLPIVPLMLTMFSVRDLLGRLLKMLF